MALNRDRDTLHSSFLAMRRKARSGRFGDLRLLGLCAGILLLCILGLVLTPKKAREKAPTHSPDLTATGQTSGQIPIQKAAQEDSFDSENALSEQRTPATTEVPKPLNAEDEERVLRDMAEQMPEGQVIVY